MEPLDYRTPIHEIDPPGLMNTVGTISLILGFLQILFCMISQILVLIAAAPPDAPRPIDLGIPFMAAFYIFWASAIWLTIAGIRVFTWNPGARLNPRKLHQLYSIFMIFLTALYAALNMANDLDVAGRLGLSNEVIADGIRVFLIGGLYPLILTPILRSKSIIDYYKMQIAPIR